MTEQLADHSRWRVWISCNAWTCQLLVRDTITVRERRQAICPRDLGVQYVRHYRMVYNAITYELASSHTCAKVSYAGQAMCAGLGALARFWSASFRCQCS